MVHIQKKLGEVQVRLPLPVENDFPRCQLYLNAAHLRAEQKLVLRGDDVIVHKHMLKLDQVGFEWSNDENFWFKDGSKSIITQQDLRQLIDFADKISTINFSYIEKP